MEQLELESLHYVRALTSLPFQIDMPPVSNNSIPRCKQCDSTFLIFAEERGEIVCKNCGLVHAEHLLENKPRVQYENREKTIDHQLAGKTFQTKKYKIADLMQANAVTRRIMKIDNYFTPDERQKIAVNEQILAIAKLLLLPDVVAETAFNYFLSIRSANILQGHRMLSNTVTFLLIAAGQCGVPIFLRSMVETVSKNYDTITTTEVSHTRNTLLKLGCTLPVRTITPIETIQAIVGQFRVRDLCPNALLTQIEFASFAFLSAYPEPQLKQYDHNLCRLMPAVVYAMIKRFKAPITLTELHECSYLSETTIKNKYNRIRLLLFRHALRNLFLELQSMTPMDDRTTLKSIFATAGDRIRQPVIFDHVRFEPYHTSASVIWALLKEQCNSLYTASDMSKASQLPPSAFLKDHAKLQKKIKIATTIPIATPKMA